VSEAPVISLILSAHLPFIRDQEPQLFEALSETYIPLLEMLDRLESGRIPFKLGLAISPLLCDLLQDRFFIRRYLAYTDKQLEFGLRELERTQESPELNRLVCYYYDRMVEKRAFFSVRHENNLIQALDVYQKKGRVEILCTAASHAFLPLYTAYPEALQAQIETALSSYREHFGSNPLGFWLPEMGWTAELDPCLRSYGFCYTVVDTHGAFLGEPVPSRGCFFPYQSPARNYILTRDPSARSDMGDFRLQPGCRDNSQDAGYELPPESLAPFMVRGRRGPTGYKYRALTAGGAVPALYDPDAARKQVREQARAFLEASLARLRLAGERSGGPPVSLCAWEADAFGRRWYEGTDFLEALFLEAACRTDLRIMNCGEYLYSLRRAPDPAPLETSLPAYSSWGRNGYAETWLNASNDWIYRHLHCALERMIDLAGRFPNDRGLRERALNQAAREILLAQASDWPRMLHQQETAAFARSQIEMALRNFTTIYEAVGSSHISTEWLTSLEKRHNFFPRINYRVFRRKE
jgi:1,4-alpha-glucan branching enzyme